MQVMPHPSFFSLLNVETLSSNMVMESPLVLKWQSFKFWAFLFCGIKRQTLANLKLRFNFETRKKNIITKLYGQVYMLIQINGGCGITFTMYLTLLKTQFYIIKGMICHRDFCRSVYIPINWARVWRCSRKLTRQLNTRWFHTAL